MNKKKLLILLILSIFCIGMVMGSASAVGGYYHNVPKSKYTHVSANKIINKYSKSSIKAEKTGICTKVIDGDTIEVNLDGVLTTVRLLGIDTPESVNPDESKNCEEGIVASNFTKSLLNGTHVYLEYDQELTDKYGRTLAYVYLEDMTFVNELLIKEGYAKPLIIEPNVMHSDILIERSTQYED